MEQGVEEKNAPVSFNILGSYQVLPSTLSDIGNKATNVKTQDSVRMISFDWARRQTTAKKK